MIFVIADCQLSIGDLASVVQKSTIGNWRLAIDTLPNTRRPAKTLAKQNEVINEEHSGSVTAEISESKKAFVEPAISAPVDVLEATTFFQLAESGGTN